MIEACIRRTAAEWVKSRPASDGSILYVNVCSKRAVLISENDQRPPVEFTVDTLEFIPFGTVMYVDDPEIRFEHHIRKFIPKSMPVDCNCQPNRYSVTQKGKDLEFKYSGTPLYRQGT